MKFNLVTGYVADLHRELTGRNVDLLIARKFGPIAEDRLRFQFLFDDTSVVAAGAHSPWAKRRKIEFAELLKESWVLPPLGSEVASIATEAFRAAGAEFARTTTVVTDSPHVRMSLLSIGRFLTILPASGLQHPSVRSQIRVLPVQLPTITRVSHGIVTLKTRAISPAAQLFIDCAHAVARAPAKGK
jgi:DNA-binding transcriptional LysR family regulator